MAVTSRAVVDLVLLGPTQDRRQLQDSPILGDVWAAFASRPDAPADLLITPYRTEAAGPVAVQLSRRLKELGVQERRGVAANVAYLQGIIAARLFFPEVLRVLVPMTYWWRDRKVMTELHRYVEDNKLAPVVDGLVRWARAEDADERNQLAHEFARYETLDRYVALAALILCAGARNDGKGISGMLEDGVTAEEVHDLLRPQLRSLLDDLQVEKPVVWQVSLNRNAMPALEKSVAAVKGDAANALFRVKCDEITWAVLDSGIDATHPAFLGADGRSRVVRSFDFTNIREVVSLDNLDLDKKNPDRERERIATLLKVDSPSDAQIAEAASRLRTLAEDADNDRPINWALVAEFVELRTPAEPSGGHGTHVAGILGATGSPVDANGKPASKPGQYADGMCPDIRLYDFRVLGRTLQDTEFAVIAALQFIRYLNERNAFMVVHGANLSLSIPHDVRNFACGRTPVCNECERLVDSGVVVVAAAGNLGYHSFETKDGSYEGYTAFSITDPGNADGVITVGATHRFWPHTYGVSFFSSRGPTGDGRLKPDLVAPGERIQSCLPGAGWGELDGTSMAAPHVSGAAAMLMARFSELIGQPRMVKRVLCETATDLGRERTFQGHGMLDVLRALQKM